MSTLEALLEETRHAVLHANFPKLAELAPQLERALSADAGRIDPQSLQRIRSKAEANARLLDAARSGIRAARMRLAEAKRTRTGLQTYDDRGRRNDIGPIGATQGRF